uniref:Uncharacterized protein n=1 Tax=viral metagenome TaxID=1070528 RepID=A0A6C0K508_9ZZZZ
MEICKKIWKMVGKHKHITGIMDMNYNVLKVLDEDVRVPPCPYDMNSQQKILFHTHPLSSSRDCASDFPSSNDILITLTKGYRQHLVITRKGVYVLIPVNPRLTIRQASLLNMLFEIEKNTEDAWCPKYHDPSQLCETMNKILEGFMTCSFYPFNI